jgi:hypothetical protein
LFSQKVYKLSIKSLWDGQPIDHAPVEMNFSSGPHGNSVKVDVRAPFFNDPGCPSSPAKEPCDELWEYEGTNATHIYNFQSPNRHQMQRFYSNMHPPIY